MNEGYLDAITNSYFKARDDGTKLFYPQGATGRLAYIVPTSELEERLRTNAKRFFIGSMLGGTLLGFCLGEFAISLQGTPLVLFAEGLAYGLSTRLSWRTAFLAALIANVTTCLLGLVF